MKPRKTWCSAIFLCLNLFCCPLTHWGRVTHICVGKLTIIGSDNGLSPDRRQAIIWTNDGILLIGPLGTNFSEILIEILTFSFKKMRLKVSSAKRRPFCLGRFINIIRSCFTSAGHPNVCFSASNTNLKAWINTSPECHHEYLYQQNKASLTKPCSSSAWI